MKEKLNASDLSDYRNVTQSEEESHVSSVFYKLLEDKQPSTQELYLFLDEMSAPDDSFDKGILKAVEKYWNDNRYEKF